MGGKAALVFVVGFIIIFSFYQLKLSSMTVDASENYNVNYIETLVHESALSAMNFAVNEVWNTSTTFDTFSVVAQGCTAQVRIDTLGADSIRVQSKAWSYVFENDYYSQYSKPKKVIDSLFALFEFMIPASKYFWYNNTETGINWITGDTIWGPIHTNGTLRTHGSPVFYGKASAFKGISPNPKTKGNQANFYGGWEVGIEATMQTNMTPLINTAIASNGFSPINTKCIYSIPYQFEFLSNGDVIRSDMTIPASPVVIDTVAIATIAPAGVIYSLDDIYVKGTFNGQLSMYTRDDIFIEDDLTYANNPLSDPTSDDILGLIAEDDVLITDNASNNSNCTVQACIMSVHGSFGAENSSTRPIAGTLTMLGSVVQDKEGQIGTWSSSITHGFRKKYYFDERLHYLMPPQYPFARVLTLVAWWE